MTEKGWERLLENDGVVVVRPGICEGSGYVMREGNGRKVRANAVKHVGQDMYVSGGRRSKYGMQANDQVPQ